MTQQDTTRRQASKTDRRKELPLLQRSDRAARVNPWERRTKSVR